MSPLVMEIYQQANPSIIIFILLQKVFSCSLVDRADAARRE